MNKVLIISLLFCNSLITYSQTMYQQWAAHHAGSGENSDKFNAFIRDNSGNVYAAGYTWKQGNGKDLLLVKFNFSGDTVWTQTIDGIGNGNDEMNDLVFDNSGNVVAVGTVKTNTGKDIATLKFSPTGTLLWQVSYNHAANFDDYAVKVLTDQSGNIFSGGYGYNASFNYDYLLIKYDASGNQLNFAAYNGPANQNDRLADMTIDNTGNVMVTGRSGTFSDKDDFATLKYNNTLAQQWLQTVDLSNENDRATGIWTDATGDVYVTGRSNNGNTYDFLTIKYSGATGAAAWAQPKIFDSNGDDQPEDITGNANMVVVTGTKFNGIQKDLYTIAYNPTTGTQMWATAYANPNGKNETVDHVAIGPNSEVVLTGTTDVSSVAVSDQDILVIKYNNNGVQQFVKTTGGTAQTDDDASSGWIDGSGNIYTVGGLVNNFSSKDAVLIQYNSAGVMQLNKSYNGTGEFTDKVIAVCEEGGSLYCTGYVYQYAEDRNICTIKFDGNGNLVWLKTYNGPDNDTDEPVAIAADGSGNIIVAGRGKNANNDYDIVVIKYNTNGDTLWIRNWDGGVSGDDEAKDMAIDGNGNVLITGISDEDPTLLVNNDYITLKYSANGTLQWAVPYNGTGGADDKAYTIALDNAGNAFVSGKTWNSTDYDIQTQKYAAANGAETAFATYTSTLGDDIPEKIKVDNSGNIIIGAVSDRDNTGSTNRDYLTIKYNNSGTQLWEQLYNGAGTGDDDLIALATDAADNIYVTGSSDLDSTATDNLDFVTIKYNSSGTTQWSKSYNGAANGDDIALAIAVDAGGYVYVSGQSNEGTAMLKNNNATTILYSPTGQETDTVTFDGQASQTDASNAILLSNSTVYVAGYGTNTIADQKDFLVIKYNFPTGVSEVSNTPEIKIFPNPCAANQVITILNTESANLQVFNAVGELMLNANINSYYQLQANTFVPGMYLFKIQTEEYSCYTKIIFQ